LFPGDTVRYITGTLQVDRYRLVLVHEQYQDPSSPYGPTFAPRDTIVVLYHESEGIYRLFAKGEFSHMEGFWDWGSTATTIQQPHSDLWIQISNAKGHRGWVRWPWECDIATHHTQELHFATQHPHEG
jgi:hypothetical protein